MWPKARKYFSQRKVVSFQIDICSSPDLRLGISGND